MSILSAQPLAAAPETMRISGVLIVLSALSLAVTIATRAASLRRLPGPPRIPSEHSAWPLAGVLFGAMGFYFFAISAAVAVWTSLAPKYGASTQPTESDAGMALLNTIPAVFALLAVLAGDRFIYPGVRQELGLSARNFRRGLLYGIGGALLVIPLLYLASQAMEFVYHRFQYEHPTEHPLLRVLGEAPNKWIMATIISRTSSSSSATKITIRDASTGMPLWAKGFLWQGTRPMPNWLAARWTANIQSVQHLQLHC